MFADAGLAQETRTVDRRANTCWARSFQRLTVLAWQTLLSSLAPAKGDLKRLCTLESSSSSSSSSSFKSEPKLEMLLASRSQPSATMALSCRPSEPALPGQRRRVPRSLRLAAAQSLSLRAGSESLAPQLLSLILAAPADFIPTVKQANHSHLSFETNATAQARSPSLPAPGPHAGSQTRLAYTRQQGDRLALLVAARPA